MNSALMVQLLLSDEEKQGIYDLGLAGGLKRIAIHGITKDKILNTTVSNLAETLHIDNYLGLIIYFSAKE